MIDWNNQRHVIHSHLFVRKRPVYFQKIRITDFRKPAREGSGANCLATVAGITNKEEDRMPQPFDECQANGIHRLANGRVGGVFSTALV